MLLHSYISKAVPSPVSPNPSPHQVSCYILVRFCNIATYTVLVSSPARFSLDTDTLTQTLDTDTHTQTLDTDTHTQTLDTDTHTQTLDTHTHTQTLLVQCCGNHRVVTNMIFTCDFCFCSPEGSCARTSVDCSPLPPPLLVDYSNAYWLSEVLLN